MIPFFQKYPVILASKSPRRSELLKLMGFDFKVVIKEVDETFEKTLKPHDVAVYIAEKKARAFDETIDDEIVITADTIVVLGEKILGKPDDEKHAFAMLKGLSGHKHEVITGVALLHRHRLHTFYDSSDVYFNQLTDQEIMFYIQHFHPFDKAGSYGVQDWIGMVGIRRIEGSYTNVMGLPTEKLYNELKKI